MPRSEAERTLVNLVQRARIAFALGTAGLVAIARQVGGVPDDLLVRGFVIAGGLAAAVAGQEATTRLGRLPLGLALGILGDIAASSLAVVLLADRIPLVPAVLLWPIFSAGLVLPLRGLVLVASLEVAVLAVTAFVLVPGAFPPTQAAGWGALLLIAAAANGELIRRFRAAQRTTELAFARAADLVNATTRAEVADVLFTFLSEMVGVDATPRLLLYEASHEGGLDVVAHEHLASAPAEGNRDPIRGGGIAPDQGVWFEGPRLARDLRVDDLARYPRAFVQPLADGRRIVGLVVVSAVRGRVFGEEARRGLERVGAHAASALARIDLARTVERQRAALTVLLDTRAVPRDDPGIARWAVGAARRITGARTVALVRRRAGALVCDEAEGIEVLEVERDAARLLASALLRPVPLVIADTSADERYALGQRFARGSLAAIPIAGGDALLLVHDDRVDGLSSGDLELLVMLSHQLSLLLARPRDGASKRSEFSHQKDD
ncbi:MAG: GAF domain-containing protein [Chloroflexi bacterium]|nr:MAG: GAF domain-containing protein [Chloroflexota bacterium]